MPEKNCVLFVCIENSYRSQMAEVFAPLYTQDLIQAYNAASRPSGQINPKPVTAMAELVYDRGTHSSKPLNEIPHIKYDYFITKGCGDECPLIPTDVHEDWDSPYPKSLSLGESRQVRDQIGERLNTLAVRIEVRNHAKG